MHDDDVMPKTVLVIGHEMVLCTNKRPETGGSQVCAQQSATQGKRLLTQITLYTPI